MEFHGALFLFESASGWLSEAGVLCIFRLAVLIPVIQSKCIWFRCSAPSSSHGVDELSASLNVK